MRVFRVAWVWRFQLSSRDAKLAFRFAGERHLGPLRILDSRSSTKPRETNGNNIDVRGLEAELTAQIEGEVRFDAGSRAAYSTDSSNYRQVPIGIVIPSNVEDAVRAVGVSRDFGAPILSRGAGTSLAGQCCNTAVVLDWSKYVNEILDIDPARKIARVHPGCVLDNLRGAAGKYGLTFGPDPATHKYCTLGGMIGNNSCGIHAQMAGPVSNNVDSLDVLAYDGTRMTAGWMTRVRTGRRDQPRRARWRDSVPNQGAAAAIPERNSRPVSQHSAPHLRLQPGPAHPQPGRPLQSGARTGRQ